MFKYKFIRFECKSSGKFVINLKCRVRPLNSTANKAEMEIQIIKSIKKPYVSEI